MKNPRLCETLLSCITDKFTEMANQAQVDDCYLELCDLVTAEMIKCRKVGKRKFTPQKPYWNEDLSILWCKLSESYKYLQMKGIKITKRDLNRCTRGGPEIMKYKQCVKDFDCELRKAKRAYSQGCIVKIDTCLSKDPNKFWEKVNKLGPRTKNKLVCEAFDENGDVTRNQEIVMKHWFHEYQSLYGNEPNIEFDKIFYNEQSDKNYAEKISYNVAGDPHLGLSENITRDEVLKAVKNAQNNKAVGCDGIPYEALRNETCVDMLTEFCNKCFNTGKLPSAWSKANITPIPKGNKSVSTEPLTFRGIAIQSCVYKLYSYVLNSRLSSHVEDYGYLLNTQNGFRKKRSCNDHVFTLTEIVKTHLSEKGSNKVFCAFVDKKKAFDYVNVTLREATT